MASSLLAKVVTLSVLLAVVVEHASGARDIHKSPKNPDVKHPDFLVTIEPQPTVLIPGMGRYLLPPKCKKPLYPYNPVTGDPLTGGSITGPFSGGPGNAPRTQIPGGDDTLVPSPGTEVPTPAAGAGTPIAPGTGTMGQVPPLPHP